jgi:hypothetical protein
MITRKCIICQGENFYFVNLAFSGAISLEFWKAVPVHGLVCLDCGFVVHSVDHGGLVALREKARSEGHGLGEKPSKPELPEL